MNDNMNNNNPFDNNNQTSNNFETSKPKKSGLKITIITIISIVAVAVFLRISLFVTVAYELDVPMKELHKTEVELHDILGVTRIDMIKGEYYIVTGDKDSLLDGLLSYIPVDLIDGETDSDVDSEVGSDVDRSL